MSDILRCLIVLCTLLGHRDWFFCSLSKELTEIADLFISSFDMSVYLKYIFFVDILCLIFIPASLRLLLEYVMYLCIKLFLIWLDFTLYTLFFTVIFFPPFFSSSF